MEHSAPAASRTSALAKLYLRIFVGAVVSFGLIMGVMAALMGSDSALRHGLLAGVLIGLGWSGVLGTTAAIRTRRMGSQALCVRQRRTVDITGSRGDVLARVEAAARRLPEFPQVTSDADSGVVEVKFGATMWSWGDVLTARLEDLSDGRQRVFLESRPRVRLTVVDYGVNSQHVEAVLRELAAEPVLQRG